MRGTFITAATIFLTVGTGVGMAAAADATEIQFPAGGTSQSVSGSLAAGGEDSYTLDADAGQTATVHFTRSSDTERWTLVGPDGTPLHTGMTEQQEDVTTKLPATGTYRIDVQTTDAGDYTLALTIDSSSGSSGQAGTGGQVSQVPTGAADTGGGATGGIEDAGLLGAGAASLAAAGAFGAVALRRRRTAATTLPDAH
ncbi:hypothetical protein [Modestobacter roseus]|uniref:Peptidase C-terminal archaeal/bacterial domain-containing protein n=1 Tax=Modestobacter roseus TaxID=1181884 RepID=A0A562IWE0_9ACTN|nr:hypothetical protein [Modestobacter roseus]MQA34704.1 hypothetical protein [Modestobacter roseus]TWH75133.1 hypothetical protein JD78_03684 [Modestobacter roseus]